MSLDNIAVVIVSPIYGGNIGSICRAMKNMDIRRLRLVGPRDNYNMEELRTMSVHAYDIYEQREDFPTLEAAVADCGLVAGTTARPGLYRAHTKTPRDWAPRLLEATADTRVALVFGPEDRGLTNEELAPCTQLIQIPSSDRYKSLNLAQAVMVCCYELFVASGAFEPPVERTPEAPAAVRERMFGFWRQALLDIGFMGEDKADHMMLGIRRAWSRGPMSIADIRILMGIARQTRWVASQARKAGLTPSRCPGHPRMEDTRGLPNAD